MELRQKTQLRRLLVPELNQSLKILALPLMDLKELVRAELTSNPFLEEAQVSPAAPPHKLSETFPYRSGIIGASQDLRISLITRKPSLQEVLLRQLGMFANTQDEYKIGVELIGNIDESGYLKTNLEDVSRVLREPLESVEKTLKIIQQFDPPGVAARTVSECLLIQLEVRQEKDPLLKKIVEFYLDDVAKKNYSRIAKELNEPLEKIEPLIKMILRLDPKPGRNFSTEEAQRVIPDIVIDEKGDELEISINDEDIPTLNINKDYKKLLKDKTLDPQTREYLTEQLKNALALLRAVFRRKSTLRRIVETIVEFQQDAIRNDLSFLKPMVFQDVAKKLDIHESTVCRAIMNKYAKLPFGVVALKDFFSTGVQNGGGEFLSSKHVLRLIKELIDQEDRKHPLSDQDISEKLLKMHNLSVPRRTVTKYREELKLLSSTYRRVR
jgi:RNA polymerase sigma-54 factor